MTPPPPAGPAFPGSSGPASPASLGGLRLALAERPLEQSPDLLDLALGARAGGREVVLFGRGLARATSLLGLGVAAQLVGRPGSARLLDGDGSELARTEADDPLLGAAALWEALAGAGTGEGRSALAVGGFAFRRDREPAPPWTGYPPVLLRLPLLTLVQRQGRTRALAATLARPGEPAEAVRARLESAFGELSERPRPAARPAAGGQVRRLPGAGEEAWARMVREAVDRLGRGAAEKVVLARRVEVSSGPGLDPGAVLAELRSAYPQCFTFLLPGGDGSQLLGASPELLLRRSGELAVSRPMAGSGPRGEDRESDRRLADELRASAKNQREHEVVVREVAAALAQVSPQVSHPGQPELVSFANIRHLATTISARLAPTAPRGALQLCALIHPTAAVCGYPRQVALGLIDELERMERGWYCGALGWVAGDGDGEFALALRCGLLREGRADLFAGVGVMPDSDPAAEFEETELKLRPLLEALSGAVQGGSHGLPAGLVGAGALGAVEAEP